MLKLQTQELGILTERWYSMKTWHYVLLGIIFVSIAIYSTTFEYQHSLITNEKIFGILIILGVMLYAGWLIKKSLLKK